MTILDIRTELLGIARQHLEVKREYAHEVAAICPFHAHADGTPERHPSFYMSLDTGLYFCHACQSSGGLRKLLMTVGVDRVRLDDDYKELIEQAGRNFRPPPDPLEPKPELHEPLPEGLLGLFSDRLDDLRAAGFADQTLRHFEVAYDEQHQRIVYPLRTPDGRLMGLSGRNAEGRRPKYKVYVEEYTRWGLPARPGWDKGSVLWNAHNTFPSQYKLHEPPPIVLVEGFKACMWVHQAGVPNVNALLGTHMTWDHRWVIERLGGDVYLFLDNNEAGFIGAYKTGKKLLGCAHVFVCAYPARLQDVEGAQPDGCTPDEVHEAIENARPYVSWANS